MKGATHLILGVSAGMIVSSALRVDPHTIPWVALCIGSIAPDLDHEDSLISKPGSFLEPIFPSVICQLISLPCQVIARVFKYLFGHRGFLHWPILALVMVGLSYRYSIPILFWFGLGYLVHILADAVTKEGVPLFAPFKHSSISLSPFETGSVFERVILAGAVLFIGFWTWQRYSSDSMGVVNSSFAEREHFQNTNGIKLFEMFRR